VAGDEGSLFPVTLLLWFLTFSSSDGVLISTSRRRDERNEGPSGTGRGDLASGWPAPPRSGRCDTTAGECDDEDASACVAKRRVRGRFSLRSGSCFGSIGERLIDRDFLFRRFEASTSVPVTLSSADHAILSSAVCCRGAGAAFTAATCRDSRSWRPAGGAGAFG
jgi:hypothetical protein